MENDDELRQFQQQQKAIIAGKTLEEVKEHLDHYIGMLVSGSPNHSAMFYAFVESKMLMVLMEKLRVVNMAASWMEAVFYNLQLLIQNLKQEEQTLYLATHLHKQGYISQKYNFEEEGQAEYYVSIVRSILRTTLLNDERFVNIFVNLRQPHCPIAYTMLRFYNFPESQAATSSRYVILQLSSHQNAMTPYLKRYFLNFPFVSYYAHRAALTKDIFISCLKTLTTFDIQYLTIQIAFLQDLVASKDWQAINMYSNSLFTTLFRHIYKALLNDKQSVGKVLRLFLEVCRKIKVQKIRQGVRLMLARNISPMFENYISQKQSQMQSYSYKFKSKYYFDDYLNYVVEHCKCLFTETYRKTNQSSMIRKTINLVGSYVMSNQRWVELQLGRLSAVLGVQLNLYQQIDHTQQVKGSFLSILEIEPQLTSPNKLYKILLEQSKASQGAYFYWLSIINVLDMRGEPFQSDLKTHLNLVANCQSTSTLLVTLCIANRHKWEFNKQDNQYLNQLFKTTVGRLINFILDEGWSSFIKICIGLSKLDQKFLEEDYQLGIFRDAQCQIIFLMVLRAFINMSKQPRMPLQQDRKHQKPAQPTKIVCSLSSDYPTGHYLRIESQYVRFFNDKDQIAGTYSIKDYKVYQDPTCQSIVQFISDSKQTESFTVYFADRKLSGYFQQIFKQTLVKVRQLELQLYNINIPMQLK